MSYVTSSSTAYSPADPLHAVALALTIAVPAAQTVPVLALDDGFGVEDAVFEQSIDQPAALHIVSGSTHDTGIGFDNPRF